MTRWRPPGVKSSPYVTAEGYRALELELQALGGRRVETVKHLAAAAAEGDRSENAEYIYRKKELREIDRRLGYLQRRMPALTIVTQTLASARREQIFFGAWVELEDPAGVRLRYRIVGSDEINKDDAYISIDSPLAGALLKRQTEDEITFETARGPVSYRIIAVDYAC